MKRVLKFQTSENGYGFFEDGELVFEVSKTDLQFDVKKFYIAFFADDKDYSDIELQNLLPTDKGATRIFSCTEQLIKDIVKRLAEEINESSNDDKVVESLV